MIDAYTQSTKFVIFYKTDDQANYMIESIQMCADFYSQIKLMAEENQIKTNQELLGIIKTLNAIYKSTIKIINLEKPPHFPQLSEDGFLYLLNLMIPTIMSYYEHE